MGLATYLCDAAKKLTKKVLSYNYTIFRWRPYRNTNKKVKFALQQAMKAQIESRGIALLFL
jgi:hypothetical protein